MRSPRWAGSTGERLFAVGCSSCGFGRQNRPRAQPNFTKEQQFGQTIITVLGDLLPPAEPEDQRATGTDVAVPDRPRPNMRAYIVKGGLADRSWEPPSGWT